MEAPDPLTPRHRHRPPFTLGDRLRRAREFTGATQKQLADAIGISQRAISGYEKDETTPNLLTLRMWAYYCEIDLAWLAWGEEGQPEPTPETWHPRRRRGGGGDTRPLTTWNHDTQQVTVPGGSTQVARAV